MKDNNSLPVCRIPNPAFVYDGEFFPWKYLKQITKLYALMGTRTLPFAATDFHGGNSVSK